MHEFEPLALLAGVQASKRLQLRLERVRSLTLALEVQEWTQSAFLPYPGFRPEAGVTNPATR